MRISFDLDDTLICYRSGVPCEPALPWYWRLVAGNEPLRRGARSLMRSLRERGWELWVYTTEERGTKPPQRTGETLPWLHGRGLKFKSARVSLRPLNRGVRR